MNFRASELTCLGSTNKTVIEIKIKRNSVRNISKNDLAGGRAGDYIAAQILVIFEDATTLKGSRKYSGKRNFVMGNSLPLCSTRLPNAEDAIANSAIDIIEMISQPKDTVVFFVMAQPLVESFLHMRILSEVITNLPTTSVFDLTPLHLELKKFGIFILTNDADGDSRELKMMGKPLKLGFFPK
uniref:Uncharacterized protein n=1 Tax=Daphnia galeata TaxID=27404 RepID=A0A8J2RJC3_9CRUS|nr:unnamed protein product [Daphnia galeata]